VQFAIRARIPRERKEGYNTIKAFIRKEMTIMFSRASVRYSSIRFLDRL